MTVAKLRELLDKLPDDAKCVEYQTDDSIYLELIPELNKVLFGPRQDKNTMKDGYLIFN